MGKSKCSKCDNWCDYRYLEIPSIFYGKKQTVKELRLQFQCMKCGLVYTNTAKPSLQYLNDIQN